ncbi:MAG TPA: hypothetical protein V6C58_13715 [Allocoleopsis sp.]
MKIDSHILEVLLQVFALAALVYRIAKAESMIYETIDKVKDRATEAIAKTV